MDLGEHLQVVESEVSELQAADWQRRMLQREGVIRSPARDQIEATQGTSQQVDLDATLQASGAAGRVIATATPCAGERIGQANRGAVMNPDTGESLKNRDGHGIGGNPVLHAGGDDLLEQRRRGHGKALIEGLGRDLHADPTDHLRQLHHRRCWVGQPASHRRAFGRAYWV